MSCDISKIEYFLKPRIIIIVDGRTFNLRFLVNNLQRKWSIVKDFKNDQYLLFLDEKPLERINKE